MAGGRDWVFESPTAIDWDFGDGSTATGLATATHTYAADGEYTVDGGGETLPIAVGGSLSLGYWGTKNAPADLPYELAVNVYPHEVGTKLVIGGTAIAPHTEDSANLYYTIPASFMVEPGVEVYLRDPSGHASEAKTINVYGSVVDWVDPNPLPTGLTNGATVHGSGFTEASVVSLDGTPVTTMYVSATELQVLLDPEAAPVTRAVTVGPGTCNSGVTVGFAVGPTLTSLTPNSADDTASPVTVNFVGVDIPGSPYGHVFADGVQIDGTHCTDTINGYFTLPYDGKTTVHITVKADGQPSSNELSFVWT